MTLLSHYNRGKVKKRSSRVFQKAKINKNTVWSLMLVHYNLFLSSLLKEANNESRNNRSRITNGKHVKAVAKKVLLKYRR